MGERFWLTEAQMGRIRPFFPKSRGRKRVDDRRVLSGIIYIQRNGLMWKDAPDVYGPPKTLYNRWTRWSRMGVFARIMAALAQEAQQIDMLMIDSTHLKAHRTASSLRAKKGVWTPDRALEGRDEFEIARRFRCEGSPDPDVSERGSDQRLHGCREL